MLDNGPVVTETMMPVNGIEVCVETFGEPSDPALLLIAGGGCAMDWWEDEFCRRLAAGERYVIRYDHRDTGRSTSFPAGRPPYSGVDLAHDALGVLDALGVRRADLVGFSLGGTMALRIAVERPHRVRSLTLISSTADGSYGEAGLAASPGVDWSDRRAAVTRIADRVREQGGPFTADAAQLRRLVERVFDRSHDMAATATNHWIAGPGPSLRAQLCSVGAPTLVMHGTQDRLFPAAHPQAFTEHIPGARMVWLEGVGHEFPPTAVWSTVIEEILGQARGRQPA
jgi:pimeloyl-ACP methyl ester carboxylesterase